VSNVFTLTTGADTFVGDPGDSHGGWDGGDAESLNPGDGLTGRSGNDVLALYGSGTFRVDLANQDLNGDKTIGLTKALIQTMRSLIHQSLHSKASTSRCRRRPHDCDCSVATGRPITERKRSCRENDPCGERS
jgi:hypothetical protein